MIVYNKLKEDYEGEGFVPFVGIARWPQEDWPAALKRFETVFAAPHGRGVKGVHTWNLIGQNMMVVIGWTNSPVSLQKFSTAATYGTNIEMDISLAADHFQFTQAIDELKERFGGEPAE